MQQPFWVRLLVFAGLAAITYAIGFWLHGLIANPDGWIQANYCSADVTRRGAFLCSDFAAFALSYGIGALVAIVAAIGALVVVNRR